MKLRVNDQVLVTAGKDKGKKGKVVRVVPSKNAVVVEGVNMYVKHFKPMQGQAGQKTTLARPLPTAKVAIINDKGEADRIGYKVEKDGSKVRIFKKTGKVVPEPKVEKKK